ncbi:MAG: class I SAM-dependent methyltransferase [Terrimicrobiaceae bacterium]
MQEPDLNSLQKASQAQFDSRSDRYGKTHILADVSDIVAGLEGFTTMRGARALDVATGGGHTAVCLARVGMEVTATDLSAEMLKRTSELAAAAGVHVTTRRNTAEELPDPDASYDLVTCRVAAHHFSDPQAFVSECARVLKPGGRFLLIDGSVPDHEPEAREWIHRVEKLRDPSHHQFLTPDEWASLVASAGLVVVRCTLHPFKQPDLEWYFETAATSQENRLAVRQLVDEAPESARRVFHVTTEEGRIVWWWSRLTLVATKPSA